MTEYLGPGTSRVLDPTGTQYTSAIWQQGKPPTDSELNLLQDIATNASRSIVLRGSPSGFLGNETSPLADYSTSNIWSNWFKFGPQNTGENQSVMWASVNGWLIPVTATRTGSPPGSPNDIDTFNIIALDPPPSNSGDFRIDYVFLEVWQARLPPNPATTNKPAASAIWKYGNVESGNSFLSDDMIDPALGFETTQRVQIQYRIRVVKGLVGLTSYPDGFDPVTVKAQGAAASPTSFVFTNMRDTLGDPGLWRAGDGTQSSLGTVDGYSYAIPLCAIFRRNSVSWNGDPSQNLNGAFNRNPTAIDRTGIKTFTAITLSADMSSSDVVALISTTTNIAFPATPSTPVLIKIGDELMTYVAVSAGPARLTGLTRGVNGTRAEVHRSGSSVQIMSGRPDGLFSDQIAKTDILDLRHLVSPNGFDYTSLLKNNLDKLLKGQLHANWKRTGAGPQGPFVFYQDKISTGSVSLGVTKLDAPDNIRTIFSDAASIQTVTTIVKANGLSVPAAINVPWSLQLTVTHTTRSTPNQFNPGDVITVPVAQLKAGLPGGDADQVRWVNDSVTGAVSVFIDGQTAPLSSTLYTVTPSVPTSNDDLVITLAGGFPTAVTKQMYITLNVMYGPGRGLSRKPDSLHSVSFINPSTELVVHPMGSPLNNLETHTSWELVSSKIRNATYKRLVPVSSEVSADLGSKSISLTPFRRVTWPTEFRTIDGTAANPNTLSKKSGSTGSTTAGSAVFTDLSANFTGGPSPVTAGDALVIATGNTAGRYTVLAPITATSLTVERAFLTTTSSIVYTVNGAQGLMPLMASDGVSIKWATTDPLGLFSSTSDSTSTGFANTKNIYITLPRNLVPGWGEVNVPILPSDNSVFSEGVNYMSLSNKGTLLSPVAGGDADKNIVPYSNGSLTYAVFSTTDLSAIPAPAAYNSALTFSGENYAGMRVFTDSRGLNRAGLELPPFYGIARLFAVYEAKDYHDNGSHYNATTRQSTGGGAVNLLRQNLSQNEGPIFWVEIDADGDSTFILNANAIDISRSPNAISSFSSGNYVIEASIFGFDRGTFDRTKEVRLVLTRPISASLMRSQAADLTTRANNIGVVISGPVSVLPGPATGSDQIVINYSRTPYQGDAWGSQTNYIDVPYQPGALTSGTAFQLASTHLNEATLSRPNQKILEVVASIGFATTLGTGRLSGDVDATKVLDLRNPGYEDPSAYPPGSGVAPRPTTLTASFATGDAVEIGTEYLGAVSQLPLGALFRDKDFRGQLFLSSGLPSPLVYTDTSCAGVASSLAVNHQNEQNEVLLSTSSAGMAAPGDVLCHVDGEQGNYSLLVNFRTNRGGSVFVANDTHPGGEFILTQNSITSVTGHTNVLEGRAFLVRNVVTDVGATEVSAGGELMMLIVTNVKQLKDTFNHAGDIIIGTNGSNEGYAAADLYRIEGHPLSSDNSRLIIDPSMTLSKRAF